MRIKISLHLHSHEDSEDGRVVDYSLFELIDRAAAQDFKVLASTCHLHNKCLAKHIAYARQKGILLIPGVEINIGGHVLILNGGVEAEKITSFTELRNFKKQHPEVLVVAAHSNHKYESISLKKLREYCDIIDAAEHSWFYTRWMNFNSKTKVLCAELELPFLATSDLHTLDFLNTDYAVIEASELTAREVFKAVKSGRIENVSRPKTVIELIKFIVKIFIVNYFKKIF
jgi:predicted metal-dependent phosphoesterase TrpH